MVENLNIQKVLAPISLASKLKKAGKEKDKNRQKSFEEELRKKKEEKNKPSIDEKKTSEKRNIVKETSLNEKHEEKTERKQGKLIDIHI